MTYANNMFFNGGAARARTGMSMIRPIEIAQGTILYRFYDSTRARTPEEGMRGVWWLEYEYFQHIKHFADRHGYSRSYAARLFAAIMYEYSEVNAYVRCEVIKPLQAWKGRGKQVQQSEGHNKDPRDLPKMTPMQSILEIYQLCIPGLDGHSSIAPTALQLVESDSV